MFIHSCSSTIFCPLRKCLHSYTLVPQISHLRHDNIRQDIETKTMRATQFYKNLLYRRYLFSWQRFKHQAEIAEERAERHYLNHLIANTFRIWEDYAQGEVLRLWRLDDVANEHNRKRLLRIVFVIWR